MKKQESSKVHYIDQKPKNRKKKTERRIKNKKKLLSIFAYCQSCKKEITKKNKIDSFYLCDNCYNLTHSEFYLKNTKEKISTSPRYIDWEADLDYLYTHFWLDEDN